MNPAKVLVVDDDHGLRCCYQDFFALEAGSEFRATIVEDGERALSVLEREEMDLLVLDWELPGVSGEELTRALRSSERGRGLGIIMVTGRSGGEDAVRAIEAGVDDYLVKPFDGPVFLSRLGALMRRRALGIDPRSQAMPLIELEEQILNALMDRRDGAPTREELCRAIWGEDVDRRLSLLDAGLAGLRRKMPGLKVLPHSEE